MLLGSPENRPEKATPTPSEIAYFRTHPPLKISFAFRGGG